MPTAGAVVEMGRRAMSVAVDVSDADAVVDAVAGVHRRARTAGRPRQQRRHRQQHRPHRRHDAGAWQHELQVNLSGMFHTVRAAVPGMAERGWGRVINLASIAALTPGLGQPAYAASKSGVIGFTKAVAQEFGPGGVTANAILPGLIATPLVRSMPDHLRDHFVARTPSAGSASRPTSARSRRSSRRPPPASSPAWRSRATAASRTPPAAVWSALHGGG